MKIQTKIIAVLFLFMALACSKDDNTPAVIEPVKSDAKAITSFSFAADDNTALDSNVSTTVTEASKTISSTVPNGTNVTALTPTIQISAKASVSPTGAQDFSSPVTYTVTAEDGSKAAYNVSVMLVASDAKQIVSFVFTSDDNTSLSEDLAGEIDETEKTINIIVPRAIDVTAFLPTIQIPENSNITPSGVQNFSEPITYTVTAEDGTTLEYVVSVELFVSQKQALITIFDSNPNNKLDWILADDIATWSGVEIDEQGNVITLNLYNMGIEVVPTDINFLPHLEQLVLSRNEFTSLPEEIGGLSKLKLLKIQPHKLEQLPKAIGELSNLEELNLNNAIGLGVQESKLTALPTEIGALENLKILNLGNNVLQSIPSEIGNLVNLTTLNLFSNELSVLPKEIGLLSNLESLNLRFNNLTSLPIEIGQLVNVKRLILGSNQLTDLPVQILQLNNLETLFISDSMISDLSFPVGSFSSLINLTLWDMELTEIPEWVYHCTELERLTLRDNSISSISPKISQLDKLEQLHFSENELTALPVEIGQLPSLKLLNLWSNQLSVIPSEIGQLSQLRSIFLTNNQIVSLPLEMGQLRSLEDLYLDQNQLTTIPSTIGQLTRLKRLYLNLNIDLTSIPVEVCALENTGTEIRKSATTICEN